MTLTIETGWFIDAFKKANPEMGTAYEQAIKLKYANESLEDFRGMKGTCLDH